MVTGTAPEVGMKSNHSLWDLVSIASVPLALWVAQRGWFGPNPGTYAALGILAIVCLMGIVLGLRPLLRR
jgi:hypothetical protein